MSWRDTSCRSSGNNTGSRATSAAGPVITTSYQNRFLYLLSGFEHGGRIAFAFFHVQVSLLPITPHPLFRPPLSKKRPPSPCLTGTRSGGHPLPEKQGAPMAKQKHRSSRWPYIRRLAWDRDRRDRAPCHICGQPIDYSLDPSSCSDAWEPDHIQPVRKRPDLELDLTNIAASHKRCNRARGDGTNGDNTLGMRSRIW